MQRRGKTFTAAIVILWWLISYDNAIVITTAPSERQVREILWRELRNLYMPIRDLIGGKLTRTRLDFSATRYAYGFSTNTEDRFQGFDRGNILVIVDEASGVDEFIYQAIRGVLPTSNAKLLMIGNPRGLAGTFYDAFHKNRKQYKTIHTTAFDTPAFQTASVQDRVPPLAGEMAKPKGVQPTNVKGQPTIPLRTRLPRKPRRPPATRPRRPSARNRKTQMGQNIANQRGVTSSTYQIRVLGDFPDEAEGTLIALNLI